MNIDKNFLEAVGFVLFMGFYIIYTKRNGLKINKNETNDVMDVLEYWKQISDISIKQQKLFDIYQIFFIKKLFGVEFMKNCIVFFRLYQESNEDEKHFCFKKNKELYKSLLIILKKLEQNNYFLKEQLEEINNSLIEIGQQPISEKEIQKIEADSYWLI